jgi:hypothetical protein
VGKPAFVEFEVASEERFQRLGAVVRAIAEAKGSDDFHDDDYWLTFFDEAARSHFWWPTPEDLQDWRRRWFDTPVERRFTDPSLVTPWTLGSLIDAFRNGEYDLLGCRRVDDRAARLEFEPWAWPYGGAGCMRALVEAFGHRVTKEEPA